MITGSWLKRSNKQLPSCSIGPARTLPFLKPACHPSANAFLSFAAFRATSSRNKPRTAGVKPGIMIGRGFAVLLAGASLAVGQSGTAGAGHWEGAIQLPGKSLKVAVDLARGDKAQWAGRLSFPSLPFAPIPFSSARVDGASVLLQSRESLLQIEGTLQPDGKAIKGNFISGFMLVVPVPVELRWTGQAEAPNPAPTQPVGSDFAGAWEGVLTLKSSWEESDPRIGQATPIRITLANAAGTFTKLGATDPALPIGNITLDGSRVQFEVKGAAAVFVGRIEGDQLTGEWTQFDADPVALVLHRAPAAAAN